MECGPELTELLSLASWCFPFCTGVCIWSSYWSSGSGSSVQFKLWEVCSVENSQRLKRRLNWRSAVRISTPVTLRTNRLNEWLVSWYLAVGRFVVWLLYRRRSAVQWSAVLCCWLSPAFLLTPKLLVVLPSAVDVSVGSRRDQWPHFCSFQTFTCFEKGPLARGEVWLLLVAPPLLGGRSSRHPHKHTHTELYTNVNFLFPVSYRWPNREHGKILWNSPFKKAKLSL
jgi:hypothetical protein